MRLNIQETTTSACVPAPSPAAAGGGLGRWQSPISYVFSGLALMSAVIVVALILLACTYMKSGDESTTEKSQKPEHAFKPEMEPRIVVIMAGEINPTHLAKPVAAT